MRFVEEEQYMSIEKANSRVDPKKKKQIETNKKKKEMEYSLFISQI